MTNKELKKKAKQLYEAGGNQAEISRRIGVSRRTIYAWVKAWKLTPPAKRIIATSKQKEQLEPGSPSIEPTKLRVGRPYKFDDPDEVQRLGDEYFDKMQKENRPPTITGLALHLGTYRDTLINMAKSAKFYDIIKRFKERVHCSVEERLFSTCPTGAIFWLKNYGWHDTQATVFPDKDGNPQSISPGFSDTERAARMIFLMEKAAKRAKGEETEE